MGTFRTRPINETEFVHRRRRQDERIQALHRSLHAVHSTSRPPLFARFVARIGPLSVGPGNRVNAYIPVHIAEAIERGEFVEASAPVALDMIVGVGVTIVARMLTAMRTMHM